MFLPKELNSRSPSLRVQIACLFVCTLAGYYISGFETVETGPADPSSPLPAPERRRRLL